MQLPGGLTSSSLNLLSSCIIALAQSNDRMPEMKNGSFYGLGLLERASWSVLSLEAMFLSEVQATMLVSLVYVATPGCVDACGPCMYLWSVLLLEVCGWGNDACGS